MASVEQADIRGLQIDRVVKGFALREYVFKNDLTTSTMSDDGIRYYEEDANDLEATAPSAIANVSPLSAPVHLEVNWTRKTAYYKKYMASSVISMEDIKSAEIPVLARTLLRLTRAVTKAVDTAIYNTVAASVPGANTFNATDVGGAQWDADAGQDPIRDLMRAKRLIAQNDYNPEGASLWLNPIEYESLVTWLISSKGASIPNFASDKIKSGVVMSILGLNIRVSNNVGNIAIVIVPKTATWYSFMPITARVIEEPGLHSTLRVFELGVPVVHEVNALARINNVRT